MLRTVLVLGGIVVVVIGLGQLVFGRDGDGPSAVEWQQPLSQAREAADFPVWAPPGLPSGWKATSVSYEPGARGRWHLGLLTDDGDYLGVEVSPVGERAMVERFAPSTSGDGRTRAGGQVWSLRTGEGETTLVRDDDGTTVLVTGTAPRPEVEQVAGSLTTG